MTEPGETSGASARGWEIAALLLGGSLTLYALLAVAVRFELQAWELHDGTVFFVIAGAALVAGVALGPRLARKPWRGALPQWLASLVVLAVALASAAQSTFRPAAAAVIVPLVLGFSLGVDLRALARALGADDAAPRSVTLVLASLGLSIAAPLVVRPYLGVCASLAAVALIFAVWSPARAPRAPRRRWLAAGLGLAAAASMTWLLWTGPHLTYYHAAFEIIEARPVRDGFSILDYRSPSSPSQLVFYRDSTFYDSFKEPRRREALVCPALAQVPRPARVLVVGGESTGVVRLLLRETEAAKIVVLTPFPEVYRFLDRMRTKRGEGSTADHARVSIVTTSEGEGLERLAEQGQRFDLILVDLPEAGPSLPWPHSSGFYSDLARCLSEQGVVVTRVGDAFASGKIASCFFGNVNATFKHARLFRDFAAGVADVSIDVMVLAANRPLDPPEKLSPTCSTMLGPEAGGYLFSLGKMDRLEPMNEPEGGCLYRYYEGGS